MQGRLSRAERYQKVSAQYLDLAKTAPSLFLRSYYQRTGEKYRSRAEGELEKKPRGVAAATAAPRYSSIRTLATALDHPLSMRRGLVLSAHWSLTGRKPAPRSELVARR
jgi:hypothetical protein